MQNFQKIFYFRYTIILMVVLFHGGMTAQEKVIADEALAEKVYLQLDRDVYAADETVWFKAFVTYALNHIPSSLTGVLHVELIGPAQDIIEEKRIKIENGVGSNFFDLENFYTPGRYQIRAFTQWNLNFKEAFIFSTYISVTNPSLDSQEPITLIDYDADSDKIRLKFNPSLLDTAAVSEVEVDLLTDEDEEFYTVKSNKNGFFLYEDRLGNLSKSLTFRLNAPNGKSFSKHFNLSKPAIDIQFLAESGNWINDFINLTAFKAVDQNGKGIKVEGEIISSSGEVVKSFESDEYGMGRIYLSPDADETYRIKLKDEYSERKLTYSFPEVTQGAILSVNELKDRMLITIKSNTILNDSIWLSISSRGFQLGESIQRLENGERSFFISRQLLPPGIVIFKITDILGKPLAERLFFNEEGLKELPLQIETDSPVYHTRQRVDLTVFSQNQKNDTLNISASALVLPAEFENEINGDIRTYFLLTSELKGKVENVGRYFSKENTSRKYDLDNLMLTQGWRRYKFTSPLSEQLKYNPEPTLNLNGEVGALFNKNNMKEGVNLSLMVFDEKKSFYFQETDSLGKFYFPLPDYTGKTLRAVLQTENDKGRVRDYSLIINKHESPPVNFENLVEPLNALAKEKIIVQNYKNKIDKGDHFFDLDPGVNVLDEVLVNTYEMTPQRQKVADLYGEPDTVINGERIRQREPKWSYGLFSVLMTAFSKDIRFNRVSDSSGNYLKPSILNSEATLVVIDGISISGDHYPLLENIPTSEVKSVEIIKLTSSNFQQLYRDTYPFEDPMSTPVMGSILAIYTYSGNGLFTTYKAKGILNTRIPVFSESKEFYAPKYDSEEISETSDYRTTLYWNPSINLKGSEKAELNFYNDDTPGKKTVIVEALSQDGRIGYKRYEYEVQD